MKLSLKACIFFLLSMPLATLASEHTESHDDIKKQASSYLISLLDSSSGEYIVTIQNIDQRLKLKKCGSGIEFQLTANQIKTGKNTLKVSCPSTTPWRIFISAQVKLFTSVIVANQPLTKGHQIKSSDLMLQRTDITHLRSGYFSNKQEAINYIVRRRLNRGDIISSNHLKKPILIRRGDTVSIIAKSEGFQINMKGVALNNASKGELIRVKNSKSKKIIQGIAVNSQTVRVKL